jgi:hypothetical protein
MALLAGTSIGAVAGAVVLSFLSGYVLMLLLLSPVVGTLAAEGISRAAGGRRGSVIAIASASSLTIGLALVAPNLLAVLQGGSVIPVGSLLLGLAQQPLFLLFVAGVAIGAFWRLR